MERVNEEKDIDVRMFSGCNSSVHENKLIMNHVFKGKIYDSDANQRNIYGYVHRLLLWIEEVLRPLYTIVYDLENWSYLYAVEVIKILH